jgi:hypothetical protein
MFAVGEEIELLKHGYVKCNFIAFYCPHCGSCCWVTALKPERIFINCPRCARVHCHSGLLATGYIPRALPQAEVGVGLPENRLGEMMAKSFVAEGAKAPRGLSRGQRLRAVRL